MVEMADVAGSEFWFARQEHREMRAGVDEIHVVADSVGSSSAGQVIVGLHRISDWFTRTIQPHAAWEDLVAYPEVERITHTDWSTKMMRFEHYQIQRAAEQLESDAQLMEGSVSHDLLLEIRAHLLSLESLLRAHMEREETFLFPILADGSGGVS